MVWKGIDTTSIWTEEYEGNTGTINVNTDGPYKKDSLSIKEKV